MPVESRNTQRWRGGLGCTQTLTGRLAWTSTSSLSSRGDRHAFPKCLGLGVRDPLPHAFDSSAIFECGHCQKINFPHMAPICHLPSLFSVALASWQISLLERIACGESLGYDISLWVVVASLTGYVSQARAASAWRY